MQKTTLHDKHGREIYEGMQLQGVLKGTYIVIMDMYCTVYIVHTDYGFSEKLTKEIARYMHIVENTVSRLVTWGYL